MTGWRKNGQQPGKARNKQPQIETDIYYRNVEDPARKRKSREKQEHIGRHECNHFKHPPTHGPLNGQDSGSSFTYASVSSQTAPGLKEKQQQQIKRSSDPLNLYFCRIQELAEKYFHSLTGGRRESPFSKLDCYLNSLGPAL